VTVGDSRKVVMVLPANIADRPNSKSRYAFVASTRGTRPDRRTECSGPRAL
jgi:hypothetical protein